MSAGNDPGIRSQLGQAWEDSKPGTLVAHEEGGFVLRLSDGRMMIERWLRGAHDRIEVPPHLGGRRGGGVIISLPALSSITWLPMAQRK